uniref:cytochrome c oxidase subunit III n=1 Tax=Facelina bostoniensis TaxID=219665 RepID=UPI00257EA75E|nr:cytochrome c oxidase subunit III [Facelina bostoniensis]WGV42889.1 cytochrome c oxidase subunit III [Facelina bostoniensis]
MGHPFHLVEYSPWPLLGSFAILCMPVGLVGLIQSGDFMLLIMGVLTTSLISYMWWRDVVRESTMQGLHNKKVVSGLKMGFVLFIVSEVCLFFSFFWAFFHSSLVPTPEIGSMWPPAGISVLSAFQVPLLNTSVLLLSGVSITWAHHSLEANHNKSALQGLLITVILGVYFLTLQYAEYAESAFSIADSVYGATFFIATGFHGMHVLVGASFLFVCLLRMMSFHFNGHHHLGFLAAAWYWHFVDVVWLFLYVSIYWWGS